MLIYHRIIGCRWKVQPRMSKYNSATRIYNILNQAVNQNREGRVIDTWAKVFNVNMPDSPKRSLAITRLVGILYEEVELAHELTKQTDLPPDLYEDVFFHVYNSLNIDILPNPWRDYANNLNPMVMRSLMFVGQKLDHEEDPIEEEVLNTLLEELDQLEKEVRDGDLPGEIKAFLLRHFLILRNAIRNYTILGKKSFRNAFSQTLGDLGTGPGSKYDEETLQEARGYWERYTAAWKVIKDRVDDVEKLSLIVLGTKAVIDVSPHIMGLLTTIAQKP